MTLTKLELAFAEAAKQPPLNKMPWRTGFSKNLPRSNAGWKPWGNRPAPWSAWQMRLWSSLSYRALGVREAEDIIWFWIGSHSDYDRLISWL